MQGAAEVVPVSSSAQLTLLPWLLGWEAEDDRTTFAASLHAGSAVGVALALRHHPHRRTARAALAVAVPPAVAGALFHRQVERRLGTIPITASLLAAAGVAMWAADRGPATEPLTTSAVNVAALAQVAALAPGVSRSGATLTALRARRVDRAEAVAFSLHSSWPIALGAAGLTAARARKAPELLPTAAAAVSSFAATRAVAGGSQRLIPAAAIYRLAVAAVVAVRLQRGRRS